MIKSTVRIPESNNVSTAVRADMTVRSNRDTATEVLRVGHAAWSNSEWLKQLAEEADKAPEDLAAEAFDANSKAAIVRQSKKMTRGRGISKEPSSYWMLYDKAYDLREQQLSPSSLTYITGRTHPVGFVRLTHNTPEDSKLPKPLKVLQRNLRLGGVATLEADVYEDEHMSFQGQGRVLHGVHTAIRSLREMPVQFWTPNEEIIDTAQSYGFEAAGRKHKDDLLPSIGGLSLVHLIAGSSSELREELEHRHPHLHKAHITSRVGWEIERLGAFLPPSDDNISSGIKGG